MLGLLNDLTDDITNLLTYFAQMNNEIADLVSEHESQLKMIAQDRVDGIELVDEDYSVIIFTDTCGFVPSGNRN